jgi:hypothetical protein
VLTDDAVYQSTMERLVREVDPSKTAGPCSHIRAVAERERERNEREASRREPCIVTGVADDTCRIPLIASTRLSE